MRAHWFSVADEAEMTEVDRLYLAGRQLLNPYAFEGLTGPAERLGRLAAMIRAEMR